MTELLGRYGAHGVRHLMLAMMDYSERLTRHCLLELPDGETTFNDWIDDDQLTWESRSRWSAPSASVARV